MQPSETETQLLVAIVDQTYGVADDEDWGKISEELRLELEREFEAAFVEGNIGPSADFPAFITLLNTASVPNWMLLVTAFFLGHSISENLTAWRDMGRKVRRFFARPTYLNRQGAGVVAVGCVMDQLGRAPNDLRLLSYRVVNVAEVNENNALPRATEIAEAPDTLCLGFILHVFEIAADGVEFRVVVDGRQTQVTKL